MGAAALLLLVAGGVRAQEARPLFDVESYDIEARVDPLSQTIEARAQVRLIPREDTTSLIFDLHNGLNVSSVTNAEGGELSATRYRQDFTVRVDLGLMPPQGQPLTLIFDYAGRLAGVEDSPVEGVGLASIAEQGAYLLYPGRWFPVNGFAADRFAANINITVPKEYKVLGSGIGVSETVDDGVRYSYEFSQPSFPGSVAIVMGDSLDVESEGITTSVYFNSASEELAREYGEATGEMVSFFSEKFGTPYSRSLTVVEVGDYAPNGYAAPGLIFLSPYGIGPALNRQVLGTQVAHQWWRSIVSPGNRNHLWLDDGLALYSALLEIEDYEGEEAFEAQLKATRVESLTYTDIPVGQAGRLPDFSPEINALAGAKGAMVCSMLRWVIGDDAFLETLKQWAARRAWTSAITADFQELAEEISSQDLQPFFLQWIDSINTPEFKQEYTIYRLGDGKGFRVLGKVNQDMDTFSMPVELMIETEGEPEYHRIDVRGLSSDFTVDAFGKPKRVVLDPKDRILRFDDSIRVLVAIRKGEQLVGLGYYNEALQEYQKALDISRYSSLAHYRIAEVFFLQNNYQSAANEFRESLNGDQEPTWTEVWAHIHLGKIFDVTGQRERAVNEYQLAIRTRDDTAAAQEEARKFLEKPYRRARRTERVY